MPERNAAECPYHEGLKEGIEEIKGDTKTILSELKNGAVKFAEHGKDISLLKKVVFGGIGIALVAGIGAALRLVFLGN